MSDKQLFSFVAQMTLFLFTTVLNKLVSLGN